MIVRLYAVDKLATADMMVFLSWNMEKNPPIVTGDSDGGTGTRNRGGQCLAIGSCRERKATKSERRRSARIRSLVVQGLYKYAYYSSYPVPNLLFQVLHRDTPAARGTGCAMLLRAAAIAY